MSAAWARRVSTANSNVTTTGWLKLKYPTGQNAISRQPCEIFTPKFLDLCGRDPATIMNLLKKYFSCLQSYGCINILCHIFNFARNNQQHLVHFITGYGYTAVFCRRVAVGGWPTVKVVEYLLQRPWSRIYHLAVEHCTIRKRIFNCIYLSCKICFNVLNYVCIYFNFYCLVNIQRPSLDAPLWLTSP